MGWIGALLSAALLSVGFFSPQGGEPQSVYAFRAKDIDGRDRSLAEFRGKVLLIVNTASRCGYTRQYEGLERLYRAHSKDGLVVLGFPCNQFGNQEPGSERDIKQFCSQNYGVTFPMFAKIDVNGPNAHPLYRWLKAQTKDAADIQWNFTKFLVGRDGKVLGRFASSVAPESPELREAVRKALASRK
ncbi:MAG: glutathione peroxidase [Fimbriimonadales bacterium]|nr:glutathione peroxidase [Fimbriimonadales bacterium]